MQSDNRLHFFFCFFQTIKDILNAENEYSLIQNDEDTYKEASVVLHDQLVGVKRNNDSVMSLYNLEYDICLIEAMSSSIFKLVLAQVHHYPWPPNYLQSFWYAVTFQLLIL